MSKPFDTIDVIEAATVRAAVMATICNHEGAKVEAGGCLLTTSGDESGLFYEGHEVITLDSISSVIDMFKRTVDGGAFPKEEIALRCYGHLVVQYIIALITMQCLADEFKKRLEPGYSAAAFKCTVRAEHDDRFNLQAYDNSESNCIALKYESPVLTVTELLVQDDRAPVKITVNFEEYKLPEIVTARLATYYVMAGLTERRRGINNTTRTQTNFDKMMTCVKKTQPGADLPPPPPPPDADDDQKLLDQINQKVYAKLTSDVVGGSAGLA